MGMCLRDGELLVQEEPHVMYRTHTYNNSHTCPRGHLLFSALTYIIISEPATGHIWLSDLGLRDVCDCGAGVTGLGLRDVCDCGAGVKEVQPL
jgi:hypothetical protein